MSSISKYLLLFVIIVLLTASGAESQTKFKFSKPPKFTLTFALSYNYALGRAYGDVTGCSVMFDSASNGYVFNGSSYGMVQGGSFMTTGKLAVDKKRMFRFTSTLGYSLFYNTAAEGNYKNQWHFFSGSLGAEYNFAPKSRYRPYIGYELMYTLMLGSWQYESLDEFGEKSQVYLKFKPAHRFGMAFNSGVEYMIKKNIGVTFGGRIVWVNLAPKQNLSSSDPEKVYFNDAKYDNGLDIGFRKQIIYFQFVGGVSLFIKRK